MDPTFRCPTNPDAPHAFFAYDAAGNTTLRRIDGTARTFDWDVEGRLEKVTGAGTDELARHIYSADGDRLLKRDPNGTTLYLGDTEITVSTSGASGSWQRHYTFDGQTIAVRYGNRMTDAEILIGDPQNTGQHGIATASSQTTSRRTLPYGAARNPGGVIGPDPAGWKSHRGFVGSTTDTATDLLRVGARDYDPTTGRFLSVDPILDPTDPQQINPYGYANNNPISESDPTGLLSGGIPVKPLEPDAMEPKLNGPAKVGCLLSGMCRGDDPVGQDLADWINGDTTDPLPVPIPRPDPGGGGGLLSFPSLGGLDFGDVKRAVGVFVELASPISPSAIRACFGGDKAACGEVALQGGLTLAGGAAGGIVAKRLLDDLVARYGDEGLEIAARGCLLSFAGSTPVLMADGTTKPISEIHIGDEVIAEDPQTGERGPREVTAVWVHEDQLTDLTIEGGGVITTTEDHPFWNATDRQWQQAKDLDAGDLLRAADGTAPAVSKLVEESARPGTAYNLTVDQLHTYYVIAGATPVLVHNCTVGVGRELVPYDSNFLLGQMTAGGRASRSQLEDFGAAQGWVRSQTATGPVKYTDENGITRLTIKQGSARTPGSEGPHVEMRNAQGARVDSFGNVVSRKSAGNHTPIVWD